MVTMSLPGVTTMALHPTSAGAATAKSTANTFTFPATSTTTTNKSEDSSRTATENRQPPQPPQQQQPLPPPPPHTKSLHPLAHSTSARSIRSPSPFSSDESKSEASKDNSKPASPLKRSMSVDPSYSRSYQNYQYQQNQPSSQHQQQQQPPPPPPQQPQQQQQQQQQQQHYPPPSRPDLEKKQKDDLFSSLGLANWPYSDETLKQALIVRSEQERTKQEFYRVEVKKRSLQLLQDAIKGNIPSHSIPLLFANQGEYEMAMQQHHQAQQPSQHQQQQQQQQQPSNAAAAAGSFAANYPSMIKKQPLEKHHQRNLSLPHQPTIIASEYQNKPPANAPQPPSNTPTFRSTSHHQHHASTSAIPSQSSAPSPVRPSTSSWNAHHQQQFNASNPSSPSPSTSTMPPQVFQFHHYQPNQSKGTATSPKKANSNNNPATVDEEPTLKRQKSVSDRNISPAPRSTNSGNSMASSAASVHSNMRKRGMHVRHRSEASALRGGGDFRGWASPQPLAQQQQQQQQQQSEKKNESTSTGVNVLVKAAAETERQQSQPPPSTTVKAPERSNKHGVDFITEPNK